MATPLRQGERTTNGVCPICAVFATIEREYPDRSTPVVFACLPRREGAPDQVAGRGRDPTELPRLAHVVPVGPVLDDLALAQAEPVRLRDRELCAGGGESALDPAFAPWLAAELQARALAPASIALELAVEELSGDATKLAAAVESLRLVGCRLCVSGLEGGDAHVRIVRTLGIAALKLNAPAAAPDAGTSVAWGNERGRLVVEAAKHGKVVIATGVRDAREFAELLKLGVHYVQADVFAPWSADANFDFAGTKV